MGIAGILRSLPRRLRDTVHQEGAARLLLRSLVAPVYRRVVLRIAPLEDDFWEPGERPPGLVARLATEDDIEAIRAIRPHCSARTLQTRLREGQSCFLAVVDGEIAAIFWIRTDIADIDYLGLVLHLAEGEMYMYEVFTNPVFRHLQVRRPVREAKEKWYAARGFRVQLGYSIAGRKPFGRNDPYLAADVSVLRLGRIRKFWVRTYGPQAEYWRGRLKELRWA